MTADQVRELLRKTMGAKTNAALARDLDCSRAYIGDVLCGSRAPGKLILRYLGLERSVSIEYFPKRKAAK